MRIGIGYDVHRLVEERRLILGGVEIDYARGLAGHSDADVLTHAVIDALLGAAALGDIGGNFPDTDSAYAGISSLALAERTATRIADEGYWIANIDATVVCQEPKLAPHIGAMRRNLAGALGVEVGRISVKATTTEKAGPEGRGETISAQAVCLLDER